MLETNIAKSMDQIRSVDLMYYENMAGSLLYGLYFYDESQSIAVYIGF